MSLTTAQINRAQNWLSGNVPNNQCSGCGGNRWQIGDVFAPTVVYHGSNIDVGGNCRPMLQVICGDCAKVELFDAERMGVV